jgi:hypothetical protein
VGGSVGTMAKQFKRVCCVLVRRVCWDHLVQWGKGFQGLKLVACGVLGRQFECRASQSFCHLSHTQYNYNVSCVVFPLLFTSGQRR